MDRLQSSAKKNSITKLNAIEDLELHRVRKIDTKFELCYKLIHTSECVRYLLVCIIGKSVCYNIVNKELEHLNLINKSESGKINKILKCRNMLVHSQLNTLLVFNRLGYIIEDIRILEEVLSRLIEKAFGTAEEYSDQSHYLQLWNELDNCKAMADKMNNQTKKLEIF